MPIRVAGRDEGAHCEGKVWSIDDERTLVELLALLVVGQHRHVGRIVKDLTGEELPIEASDARAAQRNLEATSQTEVYHRDGWLFQLISWLVLVKRLGRLGLVDAPHPIPAHKGIDTLAVSLDKIAKPELDRVFVGEEKATDNPRDTFRTEVVPDFQEIAKGSRCTEIRSRLSTLVDTLNASEDLKKEIIERVTWTQKYSYRCCIATAPSSLPSNISVFEGFAKAVGRANTCIGELLLKEDYRNYFEELAHRVLEYIDDKAGSR